MKKNLVNILIVLFVGCNLVSFNAFSCGGDIEMTVPHIHDENGLLIAIKEANTGIQNNNVLKEIDIHQIFAGELALSNHNKQSSKALLTSHKHVH